MSWRDEILSVCAIAAMCFTAACSSESESESPSLGGTVATGQGQVLALTVDSGNVYWGAKTNGTIMKASMSGGSPVTLASNQQYPSTGIAVYGEQVFWYNYSGQRQVMSVSTGGGQPNTLATGGWDIRDIAVDDSGIYFADGSDGVMKMALEGGSPSLLVSAGGGLASLTGIALDANNVYFTRLSGDVRKVSKQGGDSVLLASGDGPLDVAVDSVSVYWATGSGIWKVSIDGGDSLCLADGQDQISALAVDSTDVYWVDYMAGNVMRVAVGGGTPVVVAAGQDGPETVAVDATNVYWSNGGDSTVRRASK